MNKRTGRWCVNGLGVLSVAGIGLTPLPAAAQVTGSDPAGIGVSAPDAPPRNDPLLLLPRSNSALSDILSPTVNGPQGAARGDTVATRPRPGYDPLGIRLGSFTLFPEVTANATYTSNVYSQADGVDDVFTQLRAQALLASSWSRNAVSLQGYVNQRLYGNYTSENAFTYAVNAKGRIDVDRVSRINLTAQHSHQVVDRGAIGEDFRTRRPVVYDLTVGGIGGGTAFGRFAVDVTTQVSRYDFADATTPAGAVSNQQFRDQTSYQAGLQLAYGAASGAQIFASVNQEWRRYRIAAANFDRDVSITEFLAGLRSDITPLLRGRLGLGYIRADFANPALRTKGGLSIDANIDYLVTELTTIKLNARRYFQSIGTATAPSALVTDVTVGVDHELLRNLILSGEIGYSHRGAIQAQDGTIQTQGGIDRYTAGTGAVWLINRHLRLTGAVDYRKRDGPIVTIDRDFDEIRGTAGLRYAF